MHPHNTILCRTHRKGESNVWKENSSNIFFAFRSYQEPGRKVSARGKVEIEGNADVGLENGKQDLGLYDRILIGFPIWFWTCPKIIKSFLAENDLRGMTIYPFCTSGGIDITEAVDEIKRNADGATVKKGMRFRKYSEVDFSDIMVYKNLWNTA